MSTVSFEPTGVPSEFLPALIHTATVSVLSTATDLYLVIPDADDRAASDREIGRLQATIDARAALLRALDGDGQIAALSSGLVDSALGYLHYQVSESTHADLDDLAAKVDVLRNMTAWRAEKMGRGVSDDAMKLTAEQLELARRSMMNRLRRMAERQGLRLTKSRRRDPRALDYGGYALVDERTNGIVFGTGAVGRLIATLDEIEAYLTGEDDR